MLENIRVTVIALQTLRASMGDVVFCINFSFIQNFWKKILIMHI